MQMNGNFQGFLLDHAFFGLVIIYTLITLVWGKIPILRRKIPILFWGRVHFLIPHVSNESPQPPPLDTAMAGNLLSGRRGPHRPPRSPCRAGSLTLK